MISPYLHDFCPVFLLIFSPLETADFLMLFKPSGDGYSLLCSKKQLTRHNLFFYMALGLFLMWEIHYLGHKKEWALEMDCPTSK
jgi:hypothetical protein